MTTPIQNEQTEEVTSKPRTAHLHQGPVDAGCNAACGHVWMKNPGGPKYDAEKCVPCTIAVADDLMTGTLYVQAKPCEACLFAATLDNMPNG